MSEDVLAAAQALVARGAPWYEPFWGLRWCWYCRTKEGSPHAAYCEWAALERAVREERRNAPKCDDHAYEVGGDSDQEGAVTGKVFDLTPKRGGWYITRSMRKAHYLHPSSQWSLCGRLLWTNKGGYYERDEPWQAATSETPRCRVCERSLTRLVRAVREATND